MKKISLKTVKESLSRDEMRIISGGELEAGNRTCVCSGSSGIPVHHCDECQDICDGSGYFCI